MHSVELLDQALKFAQHAGYQVRQEWLNGSPGGVCEFGGKRWLFVDLSLDPHERLEYVLQALHEAGHSPSRELPSALRVRDRKAA